MPDLISRKAACECMGQMIHEYREKGEDGLADGIILARQYGIKRLPAVDAVPIKPLCAWLAGYAAPPAYTIGGMPYKHEDAARRRAEGWEQHIHTLIECGLMDEGEQNA